MTWSNQISRSEILQALRRWYISEEECAKRVIRVDMLLDNIAWWYFPLLTREHFDDESRMNRALKFADVILDYFEEHPSPAFTDFVFDFVSRVDALYRDLLLRLEAYQEMDRVARDTFRKKYGRDPEEGTLDIPSTHPYYMEESVLFDKSTDVEFVRREAEDFTLATSEIREAFVRTMFIVPLGEKLEAFKQSLINEQI